MDFRMLIKKQFSVKEKSVAMLRYIEETEIKLSEALFRLITKNENLIGAVKELKLKNLLKQLSEEANLPLDNIAQKTKRKVYSFIKKKAKKEGAVFFKDIADHGPFELTDKINRDKYEKEQKIKRKELDKQREKEEKDIKNIKM